MRVAALVTTVLLAAGSLIALADGDKKSSKTAASDKAGAESASDREKAALSFVRENHPELAQLLAQLKPMRPAEYNRAIREIHSVSKTLANLKERDPKRYELGLEVWKARSRVELLTAKLISAPNPELEAKLRDAVTRQLDVEIRQQKLEREQAEAQREQIETRLKKLNANIERLESNQKKVIENRYQSLLKQSQRNRRQDAGKTAPSPPAQAKKGESKA